jgi:hypothetical protein
MPLMGIEFDPRVIHPNGARRFRGHDEEVWVQTLASGGFEVGVQLNKDQYTYLELTREQLEAYRTNIDACLLEALP